MGKIYRLVQTIYTTFHQNRRVSVTDIIFLVKMESHSREYTNSFLVTSSQCSSDLKYPIKNRINLILYLLVIIFWKNYITSHIPGTSNLSKVSNFLHNFIFSIRRSSSITANPPVCCPINWAKAIVTSML